MQVFVFQQGLNKWRHMGHCDRLGLLVAVDENDAVEVAKKEWVCSASRADIESGLFGRICNLCKMGGAQGVWLSFVHDRRIHAEFYSWQDLEALARGVEPRGEIELLAGERVFAVQNETHAARLGQLAAVAAPPAALTAAAQSDGPGRL